MVDEVQHLARLARRDGLEELHERQLLDEANYTESALLLENDALRPRGCSSASARSPSSSPGCGRRLRSPAARASSSGTTPTWPRPNAPASTSSPRSRYVDSVRESDYSDQLGTAEGVATKRAKLMKARRALREDQQLIAALGVRPNATPETLAGQRQGRGRRRLRRPVPRPLRRRDDGTPRRCARRNARMGGPAAVLAAADRLKPNSGGGLPMAVALEGLKTRQVSIERRTGRAGYLFLIPWMLGVVLITAGPDAGLALPVVHQLPAGWHTRSGSGWRTTGG